eukprot:scaffold280284_cov19-Tisochrysis_lutea.AAC.1
MHRRQSSCASEGIEVKGNNTIGGTNLLWNSVLTSQKQGLCKAQERAWRNLSAEFQWSKRRMTKTSGTISLKLKNDEMRHHEWGHEVYLGPCLIEDVMHHRGEGGSGAQQVSLSRPWSQPIRPSDCRSPKRGWVAALRSSRKPLSCGEEAICGLHYVGLANQQRNWKLHRQWNTP